jgi:hypothetical protein
MYNCDRRIRLLGLPTAASYPEIVVVAAYTETLTLQ